MRSILHESCIKQIDRIAG